jgi:hypothetical protein
MSWKSARLPRINTPSALPRFFIFLNFFLVPDFFFDLSYSANAVPKLGFKAKLISQTTLLTTYLLINKPFTTHIFLIFFFTIHPKSFNIPYKSAPIN